MKTIGSLDELRQARGADIYAAMVDAEDFLRQAAQEKQAAVRDFLVKIAIGRHGEASSLAVGWLGEYRDPVLLSHLLKFLQYADLQSAAVQVISAWAHDRVIVPRDQRVIKPLLELLSQANPATPREYIMGALAGLEAEDAIDVIAGYLTHPHASMRNSAATCLLSLSKSTGREDIVDMVVPLLQDANPQVRESTALWLKRLYPARFMALGLDR